MKKILIIGATSAIAAATAQHWAQQGDHLFLVARSREKLAILADDLAVRGCNNAHTYAMDANDLDSHSAMLAAAEHELNGLDTVLIAHGTLSDQAACQASVNVTLQELHTNALSYIALLTLIANRFEQQKTGRIAVISSVAGDRGRQSNYVYGSAKALVTTFTAGLRQRLYKSGVEVITIKPGFVDTPMTQSFKKGPLWATPETVAKAIAKAVDRGAGEYYVPWFWWGIMSIIKLVPEWLFKRISL